VPRQRGNYPPGRERLRCLIEADEDRPVAGLARLRVRADVAKQINSIRETDSRIRYVVSA